MDALSPDRSPLSASDLPLIRRPTQKPSSISGGSGYDSSASTPNACGESAPSLNFSKSKTGMNGSSSGGGSGATMRLHPASITDFRVAKADQSGGGSSNNSRHGNLSPLVNKASPTKKGANGGASVTLVSVQKNGGDASGRRGRQLGPLDDSDVESIGSGSGGGLGGGNHSRSSSNGSSSAGGASKNKNGVVSGLKPLRGVRSTSSINNSTNNNNNGNINGSKRSSNNSTTSSNPSPLRNGGRGASPRAPYRRMLHEVSPPATSMPGGGNAVDAPPHPPLKGNNSNTSNSNNNNNNPKKERKSKFDQPPQALSARLLAMHHKRVLPDTDRSPKSGNFARTLEMLTEVEALRCRSDDAIDDYGSQLRALMQSWRLLTAPDKADALAAALLAAYTAAAPADAPVEAIKDQDWAAAAFVGMIGKAVAAYCTAGGLLELTSEMGGRHALYGVGEAHYKALRTAFFQVLQERLPRETYEATLPAWETMWSTTIRMMVGGESDERGKYYATRKQARWVETVSRVMRAVIERQAAEPGSERKHMLWVHVYDRGVAKDPKMKRYYLLREPRTADRAMEAVIKIIMNLEKAEFVDKFLEEVGLRHLDYDMTEETLRAYKQPFLDTCAQYVGEDPNLWNEDTIAAIGRLWDYFRLKWSIGFNVNKKSMTSACAPDGATHFCLIFTDVEASTKLWAKNRDVMREAIKNHHRIIRSYISDFGGYEVKTIGDSFMIACKDVLIALKISVAIQLELMRGPIHEDFEMVETTQGFGDESAWRKDSLRVRVGMHYCESAGVVYDSVQRRYDYYGPSVNCASRVESAACGGQILMSEETYLKIMENEEFKTKPHDRFLSGINVASDKDPNAHLKPLSDYLSFTDLGWKEMKGIPNPVKLYSVTHRDLRGREFPMLNELSSTGASSTSLSVAKFDGLLGGGGGGDGSNSNSDDLVSLVMGAAGDSL